MTEKAFVVEITPVIDTAGNTQTFLFGTQAFATGPSDTPANTPVRPYLKNPGSLRRELFSGARVTGAITPSYGNIVLANVAPTEDAAGELDDWLSYGLSGSKIIVRYGTVGDAYPSAWTTVYIAYAQSFVADLNEITIRLRDRLQLFDRPIVSDGFDGSGGLEGTVSATKKKQFVAGRCEFIPPILIDQEKQIYFVQSTSPYKYDLRNDLFLVYDNGILINNETQYTSETSLLNNAPSQGYARFFFGNVSVWNAFNTVAFGSSSSRIFPKWTGPVYFRLGSPPEGDLRVVTFGAPDDTDTLRGGAPVASESFYAATFAVRCGVAWTELDSSAFSLSVEGRYVADTTTYADVLADQCLAKHGWFGFTRLDQFRAGVLKDPTEDPSTSIFEFTLANVQNLRREPINGMEAPVWKVSVTAGQTYPSQLANGASAAIKDYLTREVWNSFQGVSTIALQQNPGALATNIDIKGRDFFTQEQIRTFLERYFLLYGGRRDFFTFTTPMTEEVLALELHDVVTLKIPRFGLSAGKKFRVVGIEIQCSANRGPVVKLSLWGGEQGVLTGYDGGPDARDYRTPSVIDPLLIQEQMADFTGDFFGEVRVPSDSGYLMEDFASTFIGTVGEGGGCDDEFDDVTLLLHFDGANNSTTFTDSSSYNRTVARFNTLIKTDQSKFGGASGYFNGVGHYLQVATTSELNFTSDFTIEFWIYTLTNASEIGVIIKRRLDTLQNGTWGIQIDNGTAKFVNLQTSTYTSFGTISLNTWSHIAISRSGSTIKAFINGIANATFTDSTDFTNGNNLIIGAWGRVGTGTTPTIGWLDGYIDDLRITKGIARYTADFTIPSAAYPDAPCFGFDRTMLQLHFDGLNNTTTFTDSSSYNRTATVVNQAKISTAQSKFGGSSGYFDGTGDRITFPASNNFWVGNQDFTIEFWVYFNRVDRAQGLVVLRNSSFTSGVCYYIASSTNGVLTATFASGSTAYTYSSSTNTVTTGQWYHVAVVRNGINLYIFKNGVSVATRTVPSGTSFNLINNTLAIGSDPNGFGDLDGYIDELRVIKGFAMYNADFTPPTAPFADE